MPPSAPHIDTQQAEKGLLHLVLGAWTAADLTLKPAWDALAVQLKALEKSAEATWDLRQIDQLDHLGAQLLWNHWGRAWPAKLEVEASQRAVLETVAEFAAVPVKVVKPDWKEPIRMLGSRLLSALDHIKSLTRLIGQLLLDIIRLIRHPQEAPWRDFSGHLYHIGATALPITALVGFLIGVVLAYLISQQLKQFGADAFIVNILGISLIRELGPVLAAILIAGRSGSAITAQIGVMRVTEELDAMRVMGIAKGFRLVMPRARWHWPS